MGHLQKVNHFGRLMQTTLLLLLQAAILVLLLLLLQQPPLTMNVTTTAPATFKGHHPLSGQSRLTPGGGHPAYPTAWQQLQSCR
jgi:hypothetical protein